MMGHVTGLRCKGCGKEFEKKPVAACEECWGALEPIYDLPGVRRTFTRESIAMRPRDLWRYHELLPTDGEPTVGRGTGFTPLIAAPRLGARLGIRDLSVNLEAAKIAGTAIYKPIRVGVRGNYDRVNRLCAEIAGQHGWGFENVNLRTYYG